MKIIKYFLIGALLLALWITAPLWMPRSKHSLPQSSEVDTFVSQTTEERNQLLKEQDRKLAEQEAKFGRKSDVMKAIKAYWSHTYSVDDKFEFLRCTDIRAGVNGWSTVCTFRLKSIIQQETYTVNNGFVSK